MNKIICKIICKITTSTWEKLIGQEHENSPSLPSISNIMNVNLIKVSKCCQVLFLCKKGNVLSKDSEIMRTIETNGDQWAILDNNLFTLVYVIEQTCRNKARWA